MDLKNDVSAKSWLASLKGKKILIFHPTYVNTHIFTFLANEICKNSYETVGSLIEIDFQPFDWKDAISPKLFQELTSRDGYDFILHFSSADKHDVFTDAFYELNTSQLYSIYKDTCHHSDFFFRFIFFENKINVERIWEFSRRYYNNPRFYRGLPYLSKLVSLLLSRGYRSFHVSSDSGEEARSLVQKLLHEEYGFTFKLLPLNVNGSSQKANEELGLSVKGGQQSHEEIKRQDGKLSSSLTFVVPPKKKWTSATKIFLIHKTEIPSDLPESLKLLCERFSSFIFGELGKDSPDEESEKIINTIHLDFTKESIFNFLREGNFKSIEDLRIAIENTENQFIKSLRQYIAHTTLKVAIINLWRDNSKISDFLQLVDHHANSLYLQSHNDYLQCLKNHHYFGDSIEGESRHKFENFSTLEANFKRLYSFLLNALPRLENDNGSSLLRDGFCVLKCVMEHPDGIESANDKLLRDNLLNNKKFFDGIDKIEVSAINWDFLDFYDDLRIVADDLNYFITTGYLLNEEIVFDCFQHLDLSEFEYLFSFSLYREFLKDLSKK
ncbi:hypothetical protein LZD49_32475 [Dyadobacter sp. CY261]|uniref:hypothetical protein n=1 Tax=Dyadobacter sp. CY261 TaxID=2907203 RepID=UPI001F2D2ECE|nr:hypothetical protein [Dyadobacter sp. CY261]MCF0075244.1 hypothetical protein [Dyadobacter sp. CY261]